jgi:hypothetical protein
MPDWHFRLAAYAPQRRRISETIAADFIHRFFHSVMKNDQ